MKKGWLWGLVLYVFVVYLCNLTCCSKWLPMDFMAGYPVSTLSSSRALKIAVTSPHYGEWIWVISKHGLLFDFWWFAEDVVAVENPGILHMQGYHRKMIFLKNNECKKDSPFVSDSFCSRCSLSLILAYSSCNSWSMVHQDFRKLKTWAMRGPRSVTKASMMYPKAIFVFLRRWLQMRTSMVECIACWHRSFLSTRCLQHVDQDILGFSGSIGYLLESGAVRKLVGFSKGVICWCLHRLACIQPIQLSLTDRFDSWSECLRCFSTSGSLQTTKIFLQQQKERQLITTSSDAPLPDSRIQTY